MDICLFEEVDWLCSASIRDPWSEQASISSFVYALQCASGNESAGCVICVEDVCLGIKGAPIERFFLKEML